jgi:DNA-binding CsgD family transcriptional regulator
MHLTPREKQIAQRLLKAEKLTAIADTLNVSYWTVDFHMRNLRRKTGCHSVVEIVIFFAKNPTAIRSYTRQ